MRVELRDVAVPVPGNSSLAAAADPGNSSRDVAAAAAGCDPLVFGRDCGGIMPKVRFKR
jgi:hypothetical protein